MYCPCGQEIESTGTGYTIATYNDKGELIYAVCVHGFVVVNKVEEKIDENCKRECNTCEFGDEGTCNNCAGVEGYTTEIVGSGICNNYKRKL